MHRNRGSHLQENEGTTLRRNFQKALFMTRADKFEDQFEGAVCSLKDSEKYDEALMDYYSECFEGKPVSEQLIQNEHHAIQMIRKNSFLNC